MKKYLAFLPLCAILIAMIIFYFSHWKDNITFHHLRATHDAWKSYAHAHPLLSALLFIAVFAISICLIIPDSILLGLLAGFLFPLPLAIFYISFAETLGAYLFYEAVGVAFIPLLHKRKKKFFFNLEKHIQANQISFLLFFRLTHLVPYWMINSAAACFKIKRWTFIWTTWLGILPLSYILAQGGSGLSSFFEKNNRFSLKAIFNEKVQLALYVLGALTLLPLAAKFWHHHRHRRKKKH
ncbi:MAG TPA: VTT domain-containing protein [Rhabdochlamydiaceae bacterium]|jgi:uncharacterized membrane protein YdjX (TVP38/TMEM64 family)